MNAFKAYIPLTIGCKEGCAAHDWDGHTFSKGFAFFDDCIVALAKFVHLLVCAIPSSISPNTLIVVTDDPPMDFIGGSVTCRFIPASFHDGAS